MKLLLAANGNSKTIYHKHNNGDVTIQNLRDDTAVVEENQKIHNQFTKLDRYGDGRIVLRNVPHRLTVKWQKLGWFEKGQEWRILNDPEAQPYKVFG